jgi:hypothetical protein
VPQATKELILGTPNFEAYEIRCYLQDNRYHDGRETDNPRYAYDWVRFQPQDWSKVQKLALWLEPAEAGPGEDYDVYYSRDLFIAELLDILKEARIPYELGP